MPITPISSSSNQTTAKSGALQNDQLNMATFLKLLTTQLATQDPLNPMSDTEFFAQLAQLGTVQGIDKMKQSMDLSQASGLMGKTVSAFIPGTDTGTGVSQSITGVVKKLTIANGNYILDVADSKGNISRVQMSNIVSVSE